MVGQPLALADLFFGFFAEMIQDRNTFQVGLLGDGGHIGGNAAATLQGHGGHGHQVLVQLHDLFFFLAVGNQLTDQLLQQLVAG